MGDRYVTLDVKIRQRREKSVAVADGSEEEYRGQVRERWYWLPRSMVEEHDDGTITIPTWKAREIGLV
jgi:hypothetical protein